MTELVCGGYLPDKVKLVREIKNGVVDCEVCRTRTSTRLFEIIIQEKPFEQYKICDYEGCLGALKELVS